MKAVVYMTKDGLDRIVEQNGLSAEAILATHAFPAGANPRIVNNDDLPSHKLRYAWNDDGTATGIDMAKGKDIANAVRREKRSEAFKDNIEIIQNSSIGIPLKSGQSATKAKQENAKYKADIDDVAQSAIESATSEAELLAVIEGF